MVYEFGVDPTLAAKWGDRTSYRYYYDKFGIGHPRVVSGFPKKRKWLQMVLRDLDALGDMEKQRLTTLAQILSQAMVRRRNYNYDPGESWLLNALREHNRKPFHCILSDQTDPEHGIVLTDTDPGSPLWDLPRDRPAPRDSESLAEAVGALLQNCQTAIFIDPHFGPENAPDRRPLAAFFRVLFEGRSLDTIERIEVHTSAKSEFAFFEDECNKWIPKMLPQGAVVSFKRWSEVDGGEKLHNRYILTDIGAVSFGTGLDEGRAGQTDDINILGPELYKLRWSQYASSQVAFGLSEQPLQVVGTGY